VWPIENSSVVHRLRNLALVFSYTGKYFGIYAKYLLYGAESNKLYKMSSLNCFILLIQCLTSTWQQTNFSLAASFWGICLLSAFILLRRLRLARVSIFHNCRSQRWRQVNQSQFIDGELVSRFPTHHQSCKCETNPSGEMLALENK